MAANLQQVRIDPELYQQLKELANKNGVPLARLASLAVQRLCDDVESGKPVTIETSIKAG